MTSDRTPGVLGPIAIAAVVSAAVSGLRLYGELEGWSETWFSRQPGGSSLLGVTWLVPIFGFWFGRRLAKGGNRPASAGKSLLLCVLGLLLTFAVFFVLMGTELVPDFGTRGLLLAIATPACGLLALLAWPRAYLANLFYGLLARAPVVLIQYVAIEHGWGTHYEKGPPPPAPQDPESVLFALTLAQCTFWPFAWTTLVGGIFAALGAATAGRRN